ncbi:restriction endonuclease subunit S [Psychrobacillus psychrodurans]|uniref:Restriction endonuclease subunit S n=1 Tax=Psychrobacillus psychrodurans TaxID=126157 RepID=A0A9X3RAT1_9BACI|nr:restriction endonuclease subunit S [Psychrobacillus psychrodurans]MCZ8533372.1 restriction endonuclease subunit S [Psychrobacillus psychrodurans]
MNKKKNTQTLEELLEEALVLEEEQPYEIPANWAFVKMFSVAEGQHGFAFKSKEYSDNGIPIIRMGNVVGSNEIVLDKKKSVYIDERRLYEFSKFIIEQNDILMSLTDLAAKGEFLGTVALYTQKDVALLNQRLLKIVFNREKIHPIFMFYSLKSPSFRKYVTQPAGGSIQKNISSDFVLNYDFPLPPFNEQKRIGEKVRHLFTKIDEAKQLIEEAKETFELRRAAILNEVFQKNEIDNINSEKDIELMEPYKISNGWKWLKLSEVGELNRGKSKHRPRNDPKLFGGNYPFIQTGDVAKAGKYVTSYKQTLSEFGLLQSRMFNKGTLCITIAANIADTALLGFDSCFPDSVVGFNTKHSYISNEYVHYYITTIKEELEHYAPSTAQKNINLKVLNEVLVPIPPEEEYLKIIHLIPKLEKIENEILNNLDLENILETLKISILSKAFEGKLGTNDSNDENAIELLKSTLQEKLN